MADPEAKRILQSLKGKDDNHACFECGSLHPQWVSVTYAIWICLDCSGQHRGIGVHLSFVRSIGMDKWKDLELKKMEVGGNRKAKEFFDSQPDWNWSSPLNVRYNSMAAARYRDKITTEAQGKTWSPGNVGSSSFDDDWAITPVEEKEYPQSNQPIEPVPSTKAYTSLINSRKPTTNKKGGLGGKRGGLGAQKVSTDFNKIEEDAQKADVEKVPIFNKQDSKPLTEEERVEQLKSMKEVYEDLSVKQKQTEEKMRKVDPNKAEHLERLGMGFKAISSSNARGAKSHSAISDMMTIEQVNPVREREPITSNMPVSFGIKEMERDLMMLELGLSSSGSKSNRDSPFGRSMNSWSDTKDSMDEFWDSYDRKPEKPQVIESIPSLNEERTSRSRPKPSQPVSSSSASNSGDAQKKFGAAKAISSDQFFGGRESEFEQRATLNRFEGSNSISSDDYFNKNTNKNRNAGANAFSGANYEDMKDSVREGVSKVAGKLSSMATDVMSSIQDKYGY